MDKVSTIIWDWNGTLLDDVDICINIINQLLKKRNLPELTREKYLNVFDFPVQDYYRRIGFDFEKEPFEIPANEYINLYYASVKDTRLHKNVVEILNNFSNKNFKQLILSAAEQNKLINLLHEFKIDHFFKDVSGLNNIYATSKIELGMKMLKRFGISPKSACLIGDTTHDADVANAIGCKCILIANGHQSLEKLEKTGAIVIEDLSELIMLFNK